MPLNMIVLIQQLTVDFINTDMAKKFHIEWTTNDNSNICFVNIDKKLIKQAINNLI